ncbi:Ca2+:H+ antiporter [Breoghania corrubedonensis]|uniref:Ca2+:H+ antiporter n=1 Tax=Breoghania corrubedonensis TaxID=665038 RepID=A0A2T5UU65_9HYPH|nr:calcium:proton antiporter [Breoghania corrubedonensis]PTW55033.1 Ca2+:H+ antiporter [Breoghania corrubedonensis]
MNADTADGPAEAPRAESIGAIISREWFLAISMITCAVFVVYGETLFRGLSNYPILALLFLWLFAAVIGSSLGVVRHAEAISDRLGEPYGTLVLTLSITAIEVMSITAVMLHGDNNPTLVRDTLFSVVLILMGGMTGLSLLLGAIRHREQTINLQGANAYLGVIVPLAVLSLVLPNFTSTTDGPTLSLVQKIMVGTIAGGLYVTFLLIQTGRHRAYFTQPDQAEEEEERAHGSLMLHGLLLLSYILPVVFLVEQLARPLDYVIETLGAPQMVGGVMVAILVATPEGIGGIKAALRNQLQTSVNVFLGSVLATIGLTVPIMLGLSQMLGLDLILGLQASNLVLLLLVLAVSVITFASGRTNLLQGAVHLLMFAAFFILLFQG